MLGMDAFHKDGFTGTGKRGQQRLLFYPEMQLKLRSEKCGNLLTCCLRRFVVMTGSVTRESYKDKRGMMAPGESGKS